MRAAMTKGYWWAIASVAFMLVGAFGPWARMLSITIHGTDGGRDGWLVVGAAGCAAVVLVVQLRARRRWPATVALLAGCLSAATAAYDITDINGAFGGDLVSAAWGIYLALVASVSLVLASLALIVTTRPKTHVAARTDAVVDAP
jgi:hypothetical protein